jgi:hypothetical protein
MTSSALLTQYGVVYGGGAGASPVATAAGTTGQVLTAVTSGAPVWAAPATSGTVTSVSALTLGTTGTDLSSTVANGTTTPVITLQVPTASASNRGALSAADWTTFNSKAPGVTFTAGYVPFGQGTTTLNEDAGLFWDNTNKYLGIGTVSPAFPLDVQCNASAFGLRLKGRSDNISVLRFVSNSGATSYGQFDVRASIFIVNAVANIPLTFNTNNTERMRLFASGGLSLGNTTDPGAGNLSVTGTIRTQGYTVATLPTAGTAGRRAYVTDALAPTFGTAVVGGGAVVMVVFDNGANWVAG